MAAELPELEETFAELQLEKTYAELEQMPSGALVASGALKEMRNCALMLMCNASAIANLADVVTKYAMMQSRALVISGAPESSILANSALTVAKMPSYALVAPSVVEEMRNCALVLAHSILVFMNLADIDMKCAQMPSGALVASSALKEMRNCALMLMRSGIEIANLTDIALVCAKMPRGALGVSNALAAAGRTSHQKS